MSVDVDAEFIIGWMVEYDDAVNYGEMAEYDFEQLESISGVDEGDGYDWAKSTSSYMDCPPIAIGWSELYDPGYPHPAHCPGCGAKVVEQ